MTHLQANPGKKLTIKINNLSFARLPIKTNIVGPKDKIIPTIDKYTKSWRQNSDVIVISERIIAIMQGRSFPIASITPSWWAKRLYLFVYDHPGGIGLRDPHTMELAIREVGLFRILLAAAVAVITKPLGLRGMFYRVAGGNINAIDGPAPYSLPPSNTSAKLPPKEPQRVADELEQALQIGVVIIDANDYGVNILGSSDLASKNGWPIKQIFADNPMGQAREQTPIVILRNK